MENKFDQVLRVKCPVNYAEMKADIIKHNATLKKP